MKQVLKKQSYLTDKDLVVVLVGILAQPVCHVGNPVPQMVHSIFTANSVKGTDSINVLA